MTPRLRLVADDLSGALDAASAFAQTHGSIPVRWSDEARLIGEGALDTGTRDGAEGLARARIRRLCGTLAAGDIAFKKIDSLMRGNTILEIATIWRSGLFRSAVVAPSIPSQWRTLRRGKVVGAGAEDCGQANILGSLRARGVPIVAAPASRRHYAAGVFLCDAASDLDLRRLARADMPSPAIWFGALGLAQALAGRVRIAPVPAGPALILVGSAKPISHAQLRAARVRDLRAEIEAPEAASYVAEHLSAGRSAAIRLVPKGGTGARAAWLALARELARRPAPGLVVVVGGESLRVLCEAVAADFLRVSGQAAPGIALSTVVGGAWHGTTLLSKSGAFDDRGLIARLLAREAGPT